MDTNGNLFVCKIKIDLNFYHTNNNNLQPTQPIQLKCKHKTNPHHPHTKCVRFVWKR
jgi:hypothetical protein